MENELLFYASKIKKYCDTRKSCKDCIFAYNDKKSIIKYNCALNDPNPSEWKTDKLDNRQVD